MAKQTGREKSSKEQRTASNAAAQQAPASAASPEAALLALQRAAGNRATLAALQARDALDPSALDPSALDGIGDEIRSAPVGQPMSEPVRARMEEGFDDDLSDVRLHTDVVADQLSRSVRATAFTAGSDIFFRQGVYR